MLKKLLFPVALVIAVAIPLLMVEENPLPFLKKKPADAAKASPVQVAVPSGALDRAAADFDETPEAAAAFLKPDTEEDTAVLDNALQRIFEGKKPASAEAAILEILRYVPQVTQLKFLNAYRGSDCLEKGYSFCTGMAQAFVALCQRIGLPARVNAFHNFEYMQGHNCAEVYYDGAWHFFDPTYGSFFYSEAEYTGKGAVYGLRALLTQPALRQNAFMVLDTANLWSGNYDRGAGIRPLARDFHYGQYDFNLGQLYDQVFSKSFPVVFSSRVTASFPMEADLSQQDDLWVGKLDGDLLDMSGKQPNGQYSRYLGVLTAGPTRFGGSADLITLKVREPGLYRITYHVLPGSRLDGLSVVELKNVVAARTVPAEKTWAVELFVQDTEGQVLISSPGCPVYVDAMHIERLPAAGNQ